MKPAALPVIMLNGDNLSPNVPAWTAHSLANRHSCLTPAKNNRIDINKDGPTEIRYSIAWTNCERYDQSADNICLSVAWSA